MRRRRAGSRVGTAVTARNVVSPFSRGRSLQRPVSSVPRMPRRHHDLCSRRKRDARLEYPVRDVGTWKALANHLRIIVFEDGVPSGLGPLGFRADACHKLVAVLFIEEGRLDARGVVCRWDCRVIIVLLGKRDPHRVGWLRLDLGKHTCQILLRLKVPLPIAFLVLGHRRGRLESLVCRR